MRPSTTSFLLAAATFAALAAAPRTQLVRGGDYVVVDFASDRVFRVEANGTATPLHTGPPLQGPADVAVDFQRDLLIADFNAGTLFELDSAGITPVATGLSGPIRLAIDRNGDALVSELSLPGLARVTPAGVRTVIAQGPPFLRPFGVAVDGDGTYLVADAGADALLRVTPAGAVTTIHSGAPFQLPQGVAVLGNGDYAVMDGVADAVFVVPRGGGAVTTLVATPTLGNPCGIVTDFEGGVALSESSATSNRVVQVDPNGLLRVVAQGAPFANLESLGHVPTLVGPTRGQSGQSHVFDLDLPLQGNRAYVLFASTSLYPGFGVPGVDPRHSPCNPDALFFLSIGANNSLFTGFSGVLAAGRATASLNLPAVPLPPLTLFVQGFAVSFSTASGVGELTNVHAIQL